MKKIVPFMLIASLALWGCKKKKENEEKAPKGKAPVAQKDDGKKPVKVAKVEPKKTGWVEAKGVKPKHERVKCDSYRCKVWVITKSVKAEIEKQKDYKKLWIEFAEKTNDEYFATVANIPWVKKLKLYRSRITHLKPITALTDLEEISLSYNNDKKYRKIEVDVAAIGEMKKLTDIYLYGIQLKNVDVIAKVKKLEDVVVSNTEITDIKWMTGKTTVVTADFSYTKITDISPLGTLPKLKRVRFNKCEAVTSIAPLAKLENLTSINMEYTKVADLAPLAKMKKLDRLYASYTQVKDLTPLKDVKTLKYLDFNGCKELADIKPVAGLSDLYSLSLSKTQVKD
ncbi:hypothetical protein KKF84_16535, partial [Myxococcota bacterium]|nr:hypothetical protein [Myxococcota bacterium]